jgi:CRP-like cAMP-binding protein
LNSCAIGCSSVILSKTAWFSAAFLGSALATIATKNTTGFSDTELVSLHAGEFLFREGDAAEALYVVKKGTLRVVSGSTVYETLKPGGIVGEMAIIDRARDAAHRLSLGLRRVIEDRQEAIPGSGREQPRFLVEVMQVMARRLRVMNQRYSNRS